MGIAYKLAAALDRQIENTKSPAEDYLDLVVLGEFDDVVLVEDDQPGDSDGGVVLRARQGDAASQNRGCEIRIAAWLVLSRWMRIGKGAFHYHHSAGIGFMQVGAERHVSSSLPNTQP